MLLAGVEEQLFCRTAPAAAPEDEREVDVLIGEKSLSSPFKIHFKRSLGYVEY